MFIPSTKTPSCVFENKHINMLMGCYTLQTLKCVYFQGCVFPEIV